jgi:hypothetical protein
MLKEEISIRLPEKGDLQLKKYILICFVFIFLSLSACTQTSTDASLFPTKEGVEPYQFSKHDKDILRLFDGEVSLLRIKSPKEAQHLSVLLHTLKDDGTWDTCATNNDMFWGEDTTSDQQLEGILALSREDDYSIKMRIGYETGATAFLNGIPAPEFSFDPKAGSSAFLSEFQTIELDKEIPIAMLALNEDCELPTPSLSDYFDTSLLDGYDFVQIVTITFSATT